MPAHETRSIKLRYIFLVSKFRLILNVEFFLLGDSPGVLILCSDVLEQSVCSIFIGVISKENFSCLYRL